MNARWETRKRCEGSRVEIRIRRIRRESEECWIARDHERGDSPTIGVR